MNNVHLIFYFINIFATQIYSLPVTPSNVYDVVTANFSKNCPILSSNVLVNSTTKYLSNCKDISLINPPVRIAAYNLNKFYCIGALVADLQLCNSLNSSKYDYKFLPQNFEELELQITELQKIKPVDMCTSLKNIGLFNDTTIPTLSETVTELKRELSGPHCKNLCSDFLNEHQTNELCSLMFYIHSHISNVTLTTQQNTATVVSNELEHLPSAHAAVPVSAVDKPNNNELPKHHVTTGPKLSDAEALQKKDQALVETHQQQLQEVSNHLPTQPIAVNTKVVTNAENSPVVATSPHEDEVESPVVKDVEAAIPSKSNGKPTKEVSSPSTSAVGELGGQPPLDNKQKNDEIPVGKPEGETVPNETKITNDPPKEIKTTVDQNIGSIFVDEKDELPTSTELSNKQNADIDEYPNDDDDDDGEGLKIEEQKPKAEKSQEDLMSSRADINPNIKQVLDDDVEESNFFTYFMFISVMFIAGYVVYHNKQKIMALVLEGRRDRNSRRRPSTSSYRKLNSNLEEAVTSKCSGSASHVIY